MAQPDLVLLHAPSVYDFRKKNILYGPVSDLVPSTAIFEMYPIGFASLADYLERAGFTVRIVNLAARMLNDRSFEPESLIRKLDPVMFGIDLHWLVHAHGAIEVARLVKQHHPHTPVVFGGLSSTYFARELIEYPEVDYVIRGDTTEEPLRQLLECVKKGRQPENVPNLVWRDETRRVRENPFSHVPHNLDDVMVSHYAQVVRSAIRYRDLPSYLPFRNWLKYPITAVFTCRGCTEKCVICGGSGAAFRKCYNRPEQAVFRSAKSVVEDVRQIARFSNGPIFILGDLRQPSPTFAHEVLSMLRERKFKNQFILELFNPAAPELFKEIGESCPRFCLQISPESHDPAVRLASGKTYSNEGLEQTLAGALDAGCGRLDIFFMIGLPKQTRQSVMEDVDYCDYLMGRFKGDKRLCLFIGPLAPFLDPGSLGFEQPERHGYRIMFRGLEEHRQALAQPIWKYTLNYETLWLSRNEIVETTYEALLRLTRLKARHGVITRQAADTAERRISGGLDLLRRMDIMIARGDSDELSRLKSEIDQINALPASERWELQLPVGLFKLKLLKALWSSANPWG